MNGLKQHTAAALTAIAALTMPQLAAARQINVRGLVTDPDGKPLNSVCILDAQTNKLLGTSNQEGKFMVVAEDDATLIFSVLGAEDLESRVEGRLTMDVTMVRESKVLAEVQVTAKSKLKVVAPEPTDMDLKGNHLIIKNRIRVPARLFNTSTRLIIQPELWNVTQKRKQYMKPLVFDGWRYNATQDRMHDFKAAEVDPLSRFVEVRKGGKGDAIITYHDSVWVANPDEDYRCDMLMAMENYNKVFYRDTTTIARGVVNPLRFFKYNALGKEISDSAFFPTPEMQLRDTRGDVSLTFDVNKTKLDMTREQNRHALDSLIADLLSVEQDPNSAIKSFSIFCTASPEGSYENNLKLSRGRMNSALETIFSYLTPNTRKYAERSADSEVESWYKLAELLRADGHTELADKVKNIVDRHGDRSVQTTVAVRRLPEYKTLIATEYLPRMRRVSYEFVTSRYRYLTDDEIREVYAKNPKALSQYEYFRLYRSNDLDEAKKEEVMRNALKAHPTFAVAANDLAAMLINRGEPDASILEPFLTQKQHRRIPDEMRYNQIAADLAEHRYAQADSLAQTLPDDNEIYNDIKTYAAIFNGRFDVNMSALSEQSLINEVLVLLCLKANQRAWTLCQDLGDTPDELYVKSICANRVDEYDKALSYLKMAIKLKPELREIARVDGDMVDLLKDMEEDEAAGLM